jgi:hypothetical protein
MEEKPNTDTEIIHLKVRSQVNIANLTLRSPLPQFMLILEQTSNANLGR